MLIEDKFTEEQAGGPLTPYKGHKTNPVGALLNSVDDELRELSVQAISSHWPTFLEQYQLPAFGPHLSLFIPWKDVGPTLR